MAGRVIIYSSFLLFAVVMLSACAPKVRVVPEETIQERAMSVGKEEGFIAGFNEGVKEGERRAIERYASELEALRDYVLYYVMKENDAVIPARVQRVYVSGEIRDGGNAYTPPHIEYVIVEQPKFNIGKLNEYLSRSAFRWIVLRKFSNKAEAYLTLNKLEKFHESDYAEVIQVKDGSGYVLSVRVPADVASQAMAHYKRLFPGAELLDR
ncbi:MAG: hypothetical protein QXY99_05745 [Thermoproteota archaeon]